MSLLRSLWNDESGQTFVEYAVIVAVVALGMIAVLIAFRAQLQSVYTAITTTLGQQVPGA